MLVERALGRIGDIDVRECLRVQALGAWDQKLAPEEGRKEVGEYRDGGNLVVVVEKSESESSSRVRTMFGYVG